MAIVKLYTMDFCPYCVKAKGLLTERGVDFEEVLIDRSIEAQWKPLYEKSKMRTLPQIFHGDRLIGGFTELAALDEQDSLSSLKS